MDEVGAGLQPGSNAAPGVDAGLRPGRTRWRHAPALDRASRPQRVRDAAARRGAPARQGDRPRADRALHGARPAADAASSTPPATLVARRATREPLQYVLGEWGFRRLTLTVDRRALIPRPETEILVERALALIAGARGAPGARRRHRLGSDRARDRRRASRSARHGRSTARPTRSRSPPRTPPAPASRVATRPRTTCSRPSAGPVGSHRRPTRRTSTPPTCRPCSRRYATGSHTLP